jgi:dolichol-phosphate mannosyltransferase
MPPVVVIPTYNEAENIEPLVFAIRVALPGAVVLVVDDASPDGTADRAAAAGAIVVRRTGLRGLGPAYRDGFARALAGGFDPIVQMDADHSHDPADLPRLLAALGGADLVLGSRWVAGGGTVAWGAGRRALSRFGSAYARACLGLPQRDLTGGFKAWRAETLAAIEPAHLRADGYAFQVEATWRAHAVGARIVEVPITFTERRAGASKMSGRIALEAAWRVPELRW